MIAINKSDPASYSSWKNNPKSRYDEIKTEIFKCSTKVGYKPENITFVPISATCGNFFTFSELIQNISLPILQWFIIKGDNFFPDVKGVSPFPIHKWYYRPTLWEVLTSHAEPKRNIAAPLRMTILRYYKAQQDDEIIVSGRILTGRLKVGDEVIFIPNFKNLDQDDYMAVVSIEKNHQPLQRAIPGDIGKVSPLLGN